MKTRAILRNALLWLRSVWLDARVFKPSRLVGRPAARPAQAGLDASPAGARPPARLSAPRRTEALPRHIHLVGAGGAGLSGAARLLVAGGHSVTGHDASESPFTGALAGLGIPVELGPSSGAALPAEAEMVVRSAAVDDSDPQILEASRRGIPCLKYAELLGRVAPAGRTAAVAGTHGKTTTSWMLYHALTGTRGPRPGALVGGLHRDLGGNAHVPDPDGWFAVEACEYDRSFLHLEPTSAAVTNLEADHLDCYGDLECLERAFCRFVDRVHPEGLVVMGSDVPDRVAEAVRGRLWRIGRELHIDLLGDRRGCFEFRLRGPGWATPRIRLAVPGRFNVENAALAIALAVGAAGVSPARAAQAVATYPGASRRFEPWGALGDVEVIHDYAHHPTEVRVTLETARRALPGRTLHVLFQPHQHSRTARLMGDFVDALRGADRVVVADVYGARKHIDAREGADAASLVARLRRGRVEAEEGGVVLDAGKVLAAGVEPGAAVLVMGAGDIDGIRDDLLRELALRLGR